MKRAAAQRKRDTVAAGDGKATARSENALPQSADFRLDDYIFYIMVNVEHRYHEGMAEAFRRHGVTRPQWRCLMGLRERGALSMGELAALTLLQQSTISRVVARIEKEGLVARRPRGDDARVTEVRITPLGEEKLEHMVRIASIQYERAIRDLSETEIDQLRSTLNAMLANLTRSPFD